MSVKFVEYVTTGFAVMLISFMLYIAFFDIKRIPLFRAMFNTNAQIEQTTAPAASAAGARQISHALLRISLLLINAAKRAKSSSATRRTAASSSAAIIPSSCSPCSPATRWTPRESVKQTLELVAVGCQLVRITAPTVKDAANLQNIVAELRAQSCLVPIVADIHFKPEAAMEAVKWVEVVRVNPGNYADSKKFATKEYTDEQYAAELKRIEEKFTPLVLEAKKLKRACASARTTARFSDRIMNRYGDTPLGMVESALEFARICRKHDFHNFKFSMKSSNPKVMIECYRLLVARLEQEGPDWNYPIHLGVTEAGEGEDGRIKSAIGIGSLLCDGLGDTIRVSLTEDSPREIEVCRDLLAQIPSLTVAADVSPLILNEDQSRLTSAATFPFDPFHFERRETPEIELNENIKCGGEQLIRVVVTRATWDKVAPKIRPKDDVKPEAVYEDLNIVEIDPTQDFEINCETQLVTVKDGVKLPAITAFRLLAAKLKRLGRNNPILLKDCHFQRASRTCRSPSSRGRRSKHARRCALEPKIALLRASVVIGSLLADGIGDAILVRGEAGGGQVAAAGL